jgi:hypothetical protein
MKHMAKKSWFKLSITLPLVMFLSLAFGLGAMAADDLVLDNYDRTNLTDFAASQANAAWNGGDAGKSATIENNALKLEYASQGWFGTGGAIDASNYKYLKIRIKGAKGGEGADFDLNYAVGETVKTIGKPFADLLAAPGKKIPAITTEYQDILIDLEANGIDKGIQAVHFNFHEGKSGTIWIDEISFTNDAGSAAANNAAAGASAADSNATAATEPNPKTGDPMNLNLYIGLAAVSGMAAMFLVFKAARAKRI